MKNEKMLAHLLTLIFIVSLTFNLFAQEKTTKETKIIYKTKTKKDGKMMKWDVKKDKDIIWVVKGDDFEWDTTFNVEGDEDLDINVFLKKRFPEMDSMKNKRIEVRMEGNNRNLRFSSGDHLHKVIELKNNIFIDEDGETMTLHIEELDSMMMDHKMLKNYVISGDLKSNLTVLHKDLDGLKYEILTTIDEDDTENIVTLEILKDVKEDMSNFAFVVTDGDKVNIEKLSGMHSEKFHFGLVIDDELDQEDFDFLKKSGVKIGKDKLDMDKLFFYNGEDDFLNLKFKLKTKGKASIKIISDKGEAIFVDKVQYFPGTYDKQTELSMDSKGLYYISIEQNGKTNAYKVKLNQ